MNKVEDALLQQEIEDQAEAAKLDRDATVNINGKSVCLHLNVNICSKGRDAGYDIGDVEQDVCRNALNDPVLLCKVVWANYDDKFIAVGIGSEEELRPHLTGPVLREFERALENAVRVFFRWGNDLMDLYALDRKASTEASKKTLLETISGAMSGVSPESSESTQDQDDTAS